MRCFNVSQQQIREDRCVRAGHAGGSGLCCYVPTVDDASGGDRAVVGRLRFAVDTGGTFTDLIVRRGRRQPRHAQGADRRRPIRSRRDRRACGSPREQAGEPLADYLGRGDVLVHGTTHAINAIVTGRTARTAFLTTEGHPDTLVFREGGRQESFNFTMPYPEPFVPKALTFEVPTSASWRMARSRQPLDEGGGGRDPGAAAGRLGVEAIAVCLLWSIVNPGARARRRRLIEQHLPGVPYTLSHRINPSIREYRRALSTCIDASLKPIMGAYMPGLERRLRDAGFAGRVLVVTSQGGVMDAAEVAEAPGPPDQLRPEHGAGRRQGLWPRRHRNDADRRRHRRHDLRRLAGPPRPHPAHPRDLARPAAFQPHDRHALGRRQEHRRRRRLDRLGRRRRAAACRPDQRRRRAGPGRLRPRRHPPDRDRRRGRCSAIIDPDHSSSAGACALDRAAAEDAIRRDVADPLGTASRRRQRPIVELATENMVQAIVDITVNQGIDPTRGGVRRRRRRGGPELRRHRRAGSAAAGSWCPRPARRSRPPAP